MRLFTPLGFFTIVASFLVSCGPALQTVVHEKELAPRELELVFDGRAKQIERVKSMVAVSIYPKNGSNQKINGVLSFEKGTSLRFQGFDPLGKTVIDLTEVDDQYRIVLGEDPPVRGSLAETQRVSLKIGPGEKDLVDVNSWLRPLKEIRWGGNPVTEDDEEMLFDTEGNTLLCYILKIRGKQGILRRKIWIERADLRPVREEIYEESSEGERIMTGLISFEKTDKGKKSSWPDKIRVKLPDGDFQVEYLETNFSPDFPPRYFKVR